MMSGDTEDPLEDSLLCETIDTEASLNPTQTIHHSAPGNDVAEREISDSERADGKGGSFFGKLRLLFRPSARK